ncbi:hypothetical protein [Owenweeksia hongkongensis]|uniref:hypothetical protein n=1 Tax=Owenweeksia hongkongensis TaxID=253245 RepID=UPI003A8E2487
MEILNVEILNPKAKKLLMNLMDMKLIKVSKSEFKRDKFFELLKDLRKEESPSLEDIQKEVKAVRKQMNEGE